MRLALGFFYENPVLANIYIRSADTWHSELLGGQKWRSALLQIVPVQVSSKLLSPVKTEGCGR